MPSTRSQQVGRVLGGVANFDVASAGEGMALEGVTAGDGRRDGAADGARPDLRAAPRRPRGLDRRRRERPRRGRDRAVGMAAPRERARGERALRAGGDGPRRGRDPNGGQSELLRRPARARRGRDPLDRGRGDGDGAAAIGRARRPCGVRHAHDDPGPRRGSRVRSDDRRGAALLVQREPPADRRSQGAQGPDPRGRPRGVDGGRVSPRAARQGRPDPQRRAGRRGQRNRALSVRPRGRDRRRAPRRPTEAPRRCGGS